MKTVTILGSTGSVGQNTVELVASDPGKFRTIALTAHKNVKLLAEQARLLKAECAVIADKSLYADLKEALAGTNTRIEAGHKAVIGAAAHPSDWVMAAIVGAAGVEATLAAVRQGNIVALANKESLVCAGPLIMAEAKKRDTTILPVDSEHNAIFQVFNSENTSGIKRIILTASGGPFLRLKREELAHVTPKQALQHPTWKMGVKISVDSATMVNKSLEIIEAHYLFNVKHEQIEALIHPQSIIHSMVEYIDGSLLSQMGAPDMRTPISHALAWPQRMQTTGETLNLNQKINLIFEPIDINRFPSIKISKDTLQAGGQAPLTFNAANEIAVSAFLKGQLLFSNIENVSMETLQRVPFGNLSSLDDVLDADKQARRIAEEVVAGLN